MPISFFLNTKLSDAFKEMFVRVQDGLDTDIKIKGYLAGGMAVHFYTGYRSTGDVDIEFSHRLALPDDLIVDAHLEDGSVRPIYIDKNYNSTFALIHPDYQEDSIEMPFDFKNFEIRVLDPTDLVVSKIARLGDNDIEDIRQIIMRGLTDASKIELRANEALDYFIGNVSPLKYNIEQVVEMAQKISTKKLSI